MYGHDTIFMEGRTLSTLDDTNDLKNEETQNNHSSKKYNSFFHAKNDSSRK